MIRCARVEFAVAVAVALLFFIPQTASAQQASATSHGACVAEGYGRVYTLNSTVSHAVTAPRADRYQVLAYDVVFSSTEPSDIELTKNNYIATLYEGNNVVHAYASPDNLRYNQPNPVVVNPPSVAMNVRSRVHFKGYFDKNFEPDKYCTAVAYLDPPDTSCPLCLVGE